MNNLFHKIIKFLKGPDCEHSWSEWIERKYPTGSEQDAHMITFGEMRYCRRCWKREYR